MAKDVELNWYGDEIVKNVNAGTIKALIRASNIVQADAVTKAPPDTGALRASIVKNIDRSDLKATVSTNLEYAKYVEFGTGRFAEKGGGRSTPWVYFHPKYGFIRTVGQKPQPFMRPALENNKENIKNIFIKEEKKAID